MRVSEEACLREIAKACDEQVAQARADLVRAVRSAYRSGLTQTEIAAQIGRSQPEVNRLLRFHGGTARGRALRTHRAEVQRILSEAGMRRVRVFGSTAHETDAVDSDIDLLVDMRTPVSLMRLSSLERSLSELLGSPVDLVPESSLRADLRESILAEAIPL